MNAKQLFPNILLPAIFFLMFNIVSCSTNETVVEAPKPTPPVDTPVPDQPTVPETPELPTVPDQPTVPETPELPTVPPIPDFDPEIDIVNACKERSNRDVTHRPGTRSLEPQPKIVGGRPTNTDKWPWAVAIHEVTTGGSLRQFCGGSVVGDKWVLTAAHCKVRSSDKMIVGRSNLTTNEGHVLNVKRVIEHCNYDPQSNNSDLALVEVEVPDGVTLQQVGLIDRGEPSAQPGADATIVGWGRLQMGGSTSDTSRK
jgi:trypsin